MCAGMGRAELQGLFERALLHQHSWSWAGHWSAIRHTGSALLGVSDQASLGQWEQHCLPSPCPQTQSPAPHPWYCPDLLGLLPSFLDLATAASLPAGHAADCTSRDAGDSESYPHRAHLWKLLCKSFLLHTIDWKAKTQPANADISKSALPQEQSTAVVCVCLASSRDNNVTVHMCEKVLYMNAS